jgi:glycosyltransferase involved in cell wall biosynthesis
MRILLILGPFAGLFPHLTIKKLNEIAVRMDNNWKLFALTSYPNSQIRLPCPFKMYKVPLLGPEKMSWTRILYLLSCVIKGVRIVREENIQVISQHGGHLEYGIVAYIVSRLTHRKCLIRVNEDTLIPLLFFLTASSNYLFTRKTILKIIAHLYRGIERNFFKYVDWIITHGPMDYQEISKITERITFIPLWVDVELFGDVNNSSVQELRKKFITQESQKIILFVGRLHPEKGIKTLFRALKFIEKQQVSLLMIYSSSQYKKQYKSMAHKLGISDKVYFLGYIPHNDLPKYYRMADFYVLPSIREEWSNTIMEAMVCETPVVTTDVGGNPYLVVEKETGFLFKPNDPSDLAQKLNFIFKEPDLITHVVKKAKNQIKNYDKAEIGDLYKTVINNLVINKSQ